MRFSSILRHLRCWFGRHEWVTMRSAPTDPVPTGFTIRKCPDCGAREWHWRWVP